MNQEIVEELITRITTLKARDLPVRPLISVSEDLDCLEIFDKMLTHDPPILKVVNDKGKYIGLLSLIDLLSFFAPITSSELHDVIAHTHFGQCIEAGNLITQNLPRVYDEDSVKEISHLMFKYKTTFLPRAHTDKDKDIIGIILLRDIVSKFKELRDAMAEGSRGKGT